MNIKELLENNRISYKLIDEYSGEYLFKLSDKLHLLFISSSGNKFELDRDMFDYLDGNKLPYVILLENRSSKKLFFLRLNKSSNWIKSSFIGCDKESIYLGKQVLNSEIKNENLVEILKKAVR